MERAYEKYVITCSKTRASIYLISYALVSVETRSCHVLAQMAALCLEFTI